MSIYEYECRACGCVVSILVQRHEDPQGLACDACGAKDLKRILSQVNFHLPQDSRLSSFTPGDERNERDFRDSRNIGLRAEQMLKIIEAPCFTFFIPAFLINCWVSGFRGNQRIIF